jgi:type II secretory pathway predicted ATPase ExeA
MDNINENVFAQYKNGMDAVYSDLHPKSYDNRPWLQAQMPISRPADIIKEIERRRRFFDEKWRNEDTKSRLVSLEMQSEEIFVPRQGHLELAQLLQEKVFARYHNVDISVPGFILPTHQTTTGARNLVIYGESGSGKSRAVRAAASLFPQVIVHSSYKGKPLTMKQVSYVRVITPVKAGAKVLFFDICSELIKALGKKPMSGNPSEDALALKLSQDAKTMGIGFIIVDELQHMLDQSSKLRRTTMAAFTRLNEISGIPIIFIGTPDTKKIFKRMHSARRCIMVHWKKVQSGEWNQWLESVLSQHLVREPIELNGPLSKFIWEFSLGLPSLVASLFTQAQRLTLLDGREKVLEDDWKRAAKAIDSTDEAVQKLRVIMLRNAEKARAERAAAEHEASKSQPAPSGAPGSHGTTSSPTTEAKLPKKRSQDKVPNDPQPSFEE